MADLIADPRQLDIEDAILDSRWKALVEMFEIVTITTVVENADDSGNPDSGTEDCG